MSNAYFQFKQFKVSQEGCAMKVCTDACILGAWFAAKVPPWSQVLDIGSGTGLLMLMLAQKLKGDIRGIEIDLAAWEQARKNLAASPWKSRLRVFPGDVRQYQFRTAFDFIIANPPFYEGDLESGSGAKNLAKHSKELTLAELLAAIGKNLKGDGAFGLLLPYHRMTPFEAMASEAGYYLQEKLLLRQTPSHEPFRAILHFSRHAERSIPQSELVIKDAEGNDTAEFVELLRDYYLYL